MATLRFAELGQHQVFGELEAGCAEFRREMPPRAFERLANGRGRTLGSAPQPTLAPKKARIRQVKCFIAPRLPPEGFTPSGGVTVQVHGSVGLWARLRPKATGMATFGVRHFLCRFSSQRSGGKGALSARSARAAGLPWFVASRKCVDAGAGSHDDGPGSSAPLGSKAAKESPHSTASSGLAAGRGEPIRR